DDCGASWRLNRELWERPERAQWFGGGYDHPGIHSICVDPRDSRHLTVAVSCGGVWQSHDDGRSWTCTTKGMRADYMPPEQSEEAAIQDPHRLVQCQARPEFLWVQHHNGIFRSRDGGLHWQGVVAEPSSFGFAVAVHPRQPDTAWFVPATKDECRIPRDARFVVTRTRDGGRSFETLERGLPDGPAYDLVYRHGLDIDPSGERLAMGSTTGGLWLSENGGEDWQQLSANLPPIYCVRFA
ncbi:WD40/YVTN/BNR-like repeat-containing protein, partial [Pseudomonas aeruginosa]